MTSAGLLLYRETEGRLEVLLAHPGGPFWARKDEGAWTIPKGAITDGEEPLAADVIAASSGAAVLAPRTSVSDLVALARAAALVVSGDTGPLHLATAVGTPSVSLFGPTDPARNGPFSDDDIAVSRYESCDCHYERRCHEAQWCLGEVTVAEVCAAVQRRMRGSAR